MHWLRRVPLMEWKTRKPQQTTQQELHVDELFEMAAEEPGGSFHNRERR